MIHEFQELYNAVEFADKHKRARVSLKSTSECGDRVVSTMLLVSDVPCSNAGQEIAYRHGGFCVFLQSLWINVDWNHNLSEKYFLSRSS
jgi:hypothetical protein